MSKLVTGDSSTASKDIGAPPGDVSKRRTAEVLVIVLEARYSATGTQIEVASKSMPPG